MLITEILNLQISWVLIVEQDQLNKIIGKWFVRRTKSIIADQLPCKGLHVGRILWHYTIVSVFA